MKGQEDVIISGGSFTGLAADLNPPLTEPQELSWWTVLLAALLIVGIIAVVLWLWTRGYPPI